MADVSKKRRGIFYIEADKGYFFEASLPSLLVVPFPADAFSNLEVINRKKLGALVQAFIQVSNISNIETVIVLAPNITFQKDFVGVSSPTQLEIKKFLELVPFEEVTSKQFVIGPNTRVVAANKELIDVVEAAFIAQKSQVKGAFPLAFFQILLPQLQTKLDFNAILTKVDYLQKYNFLREVELPPVSVLAPPKEKTRLYLLLGVFGVLLLVLFSMVYITFFSKSSSPTSLPIPKVIVPTIMPTAVPVATSSAKTSPIEAK